ncbi:hypothetical protein ACWD5F_11470 [Streptomyces sp. NPDC002499]
MRGRDVRGHGQVRTAKYAGLLALRHADALAARYAAALRPALAPPPPTPFAGRALNRPRLLLPALHALRAALDDLAAAATAAAPPATAHEDDALRRCPTANDHNTQGPRA